jgi:hypothetical protein
MRIAKFNVQDPFDPSATGDKVDEILSQMDGILDWEVQPDGDVSVKYIPDSISDRQIEAALRGMGFELRHISDDLRIGSELKPKAWR